MEEMKIEITADQLAKACAQTTYELGEKLGVGAEAADPTELPDDDDLPFCVPATGPPAAGPISE